MTAEPLIPGAIVTSDATITIHHPEDLISMTVVNTGDRPIQVGSHFHFAETNPALAFDRRAARGFRLAIPSGTSVRFEPGIDREVLLAPYRGARFVAGFRGEVAGPLDPAAGR